MASLDDIAALRRMTALADDDPTYTNTLLGTYIDNLGSLEAAAAAVWGEKAASAAALVDMSESGSARSLSQLQANALKMQEHFKPDLPATETGGTSFTVAVERA